MGRELAGVKKEVWGLSLVGLPGVWVWALAGVGTRGSRGCWRCLGE